MSEVAESFKRSSFYRPVNHYRAAGHYFAAISPDRIERAGRPLSREADAGVAQRPHGRVAHAGRAGRAQRADAGRRGAAPSGPAAVGRMSRDRTGAIDLGGGMRGRPFGAPRMVPPAPGGPVAQVGEMLRGEVEATAPSAGGGIDAGGGMRGKPAIRRTATAIMVRSASSLKARPIAPTSWPIRTTSAANRSPTRRCRTIRCVPSSTSMTGPGGKRFAEASKARQAEADAARAETMPKAGQPSLLEKGLRTGVVGATPNADAASGRFDVHVHNPGADTRVTTRATDPIFREIKQTRGRQIQAAGEDV